MPDIKAFVQMELRPSLLTAALLCSYSDYFSQGLCFAGMFGATHLWSRPDHAFKLDITCKAGLQTGFTCSEIQTTPAVC